RSGKTHGGGPGLDWRPMAAPPLFSLGLDQTGQLCAELGYSPRWAAGVRRALLTGAEPQVPAGLAAVLWERVTPLASRIELAACSADGAEKVLVRLPDGEAVEAVRLTGGVRPSACLSTQVGCAMACRFCASGLRGVRRNLEPFELLEQ